MMRYDRVVRRLNEFRKEGYAFGVVSAFGEASVGAASGDTVRLIHTARKTFGQGTDCSHL